MKIRSYVDKVKNIYFKSNYVDISPTDTPTCLALKYRSEKFKKIILNLNSNGNNVFVFYILCAVTTHHIRKH